MHKLRKYLFLTILIFFKISSWSYVYNLKPNDLHIELGKIKNGYVCTKTNLENFSQLIFSWNAIRPSRGYYIFSIQVQDAVSKKWYNWHDIAKWGTSIGGNKIQHSYENGHDKHSKFFYVRLELPNNRLASGFRVKVDTFGNADIDKIHKLSFNLINFNDFKTEMYSKNMHKLESVLIKSVPKLSQMVIDHPKFDELCSPTSTSMFLSYLLNKNINPKKFALGVYDQKLERFGSWPFNVAHAFEVSGGKYSFHTERLKSFKVLHDYLSKSMPVVVSIRGPINGGARPYKNGHLLLVIGYDNKNKKVICHDPAFEEDHKTLVSYDLKDFIESWEKSKRLAYVATKIK